MSLGQAVLIILKLKLCSSFELLAYRDHFGFVTNNDDGLVSFAVTCEEYLGHCDGCGL